MGFGSPRTFNRLLGHLEQAAVGVLTVMNLRPASSLPIRLGKDCTKVEFPRSVLDVSRSLSLSLSRWLCPKYRKRERERERVREMMLLLLDEA